MSRPSGSIAVSEILVGGDAIRTDDAVKGLCDMCGTEVYTRFKDRPYHKYLMCVPCAEKTQKELEADERKAHN